MKATFDYTGSTFDSFLEEEGIREEVEATAAKRVIAWQLEQAMQAQNKTKSALAREMHTSRTQVERLLDPSNTAVSVQIISRAAGALGKKFSMVLTDVTPPCSPVKSGRKVVHARLGKKTRSLAGADLNKGVVAVRRGGKKAPRTAKQERRKDTYG